MEKGEGLHGPTFFGILGEFFGQCCKRVKTAGRPIQMDATGV
jgi:hypothetical protein